MKRTKRIIALMLLVAFCGMSLFAQAPAKIRYQAVARDAENAIIQEKPVALQVSILQGSLTGTAVYVETSNVTTNFDGLMSFTIGEGTPTTGTLADVDWAKGPYFVQVAIDADGGTNYTTVATNQLLSVPYAFYAEKSANAFDGEYSGLINTPEIPVIPTQTSGYENDAEYITAEKQELSITGQNLSISEGNTIVLPTSTTIEFNDLTNHPEGKNNGDMLFWNDNTKKWEIIAAGKPGQVLGFFTKEPAWGDMDENGALTTKNCGTLVDVDGNSYKTVIIGKQCWMAENLRVKHTPDGKNEIKPCADGTNPSNVDASQGYRWYFEVNDDVTGHNVLYPWSTAANVKSNTTENSVQGICPDGWHLPAAKEVLIMFNAIDPDVNVNYNYKTTANNNNGIKSNNKLAIKLALPQGTGEGYGHWLHYKGPGYVGPNDGTPTSQGGGGSDYAHVANTPGYLFPNYEDKDFNQSGFCAKPSGYKNRNSPYKYMLNGTLQFWAAYGASPTTTAIYFKVAMNVTGFVPFYRTDLAKEFVSVRCVNDNEF